MTGEPNEFLRRNLNPNYQVPEHLGEAPIVRLVPFAKTSGDLVTEEGRAELAEHPEQVALDVLGLIGGGNKSGQRLAPAMEKASAATTKVADTLSKTATGRSLVDGVARATAKTREWLPTARSQVVGEELGQAQRAAFSQVERNAGKYLDDIKAAKLTPEETDALVAAAQKGERPTDPKFGALYDRLKEYEVADRTNKLERTVPESMHAIIRDQVEELLTPRLASTALGPDRTRAMFDAFKKGDANPVPEASKAWDQITNAYESRLKHHQRQSKLFELDVRIPGVEPQVFPWKDYSRLRRAQARLDRGDITPEAYRAIVDKTTPGKYEPLLQAQKAELALAQNRRRYEPGFGAAAYDQAVEGLNETWTKIAERGANPVYLHREALKGLTDEVSRPGFKLTTKQAGSLKKTTGGATHYETDPAVMMLKNEFDLANQTVVQDAVANVYRRVGGKPWERAVKDFVDQGYSPAKAEGRVRARYAGIKADGKLVKPEPGTLLIPRDVGQAFKFHFESVAPSMLDEAFGLWMIPTLWMSPMFHVNNIVGGAVITSLKSPNSVLDLLAYGNEARRAIKGGSVDSRVPLGAGMAPQYTKNFTRASRLEEGGRLAKVWEKLPGSKMVDRSRRLGEFMDSWYKTVTFLSEYDRAIAKGLDSWTARETAGHAARNLMQNWDSFTPIERAFVQRIYPFWGFRKAMLRTVLTYPMDHPFRMHFLYQMSRDIEEKENLPREWEHLLGIGGEGKDGKRYYINIKGLDPFTDTADIFTMKGFLSNLNPAFRWVPEGFGVDTYRGGVPYYPFASEPGVVDPDTGKRHRGFDWDVLWRVVPQISAFATAAGQLDLPPPDENSPTGWVAWLDRYGSLLRTTPGLSRKSVDKAEADFRKSLKEWQTATQKAEAKKEAPTSAPPPKVAVGATPAPATPEPSGLTYNPWTGEYE